MVLMSTGWLAEAKVIEPTYRQLYEPAKVHYRNTALSLSTIPAYS